eukprot:7053756-Pyramimonas_sp.AAC.2
MFHSPQPGAQLLAHPMGGRCDLGGRGRNACARRGYARLISAVRAGRGAQAASCLGIPLRLKGISDAVGPVAQKFPTVAAPGG